MTNQVLHYEGFSISVPESWDEISETLDNPDAPFTFADQESDVGALQVSPAHYKSGVRPNIGSKDLSELLEDFASQHGLGDPFDRSSYPGEVLIEGASFHSQSDLVRV